MLIKAHIYPCSKEESVKANWAGRIQGERAAQAGRGFG